MDTIDRHRLEQKILSLIKNNNLSDAVDCAVKTNDECLKLFTFREIVYNTNNSSNYTFKLIKIHRLIDLNVELVVDMLRTLNNNNNDIFVHLAYEPNTDLLFSVFTDKKLIQYFKTQDDCTKLCQTYSRVLILLKLHLTMQLILSNISLTDYYKIESSISKMSELC